jgi:hypothetical protein
MEKLNYPVQAELGKPPHLLHFEYATGGGGSFFQADDTLLATLQIRHRPTYRGRLVINVNEPAYHLKRIGGPNQRHYQLDRTRRRLGEAVYESTDNRVRLLYSGQAFQIEAHTLKTHHGEVYAAHQLPVGSRSLHGLKIFGRVELPLLAFYLFIILDPDTHKNTR